MYVGIFCFVFLGMAYVYQNNLVYLYVFIAFSFFVTAMALSNRNIHQLSIQSTSVLSYFADRPGFLNLHIQSRNRISTRGLEAFIHSNRRSGIDEIEPTSTANVQILLPDFKRGIYPIPNVFIRSRYPFGFFNCWKFATSDGKFVVYPAKKGLPDLPLGNLGTIEDGKEKGKGPVEDFIGHQPWNSSISFRRIDWKVKARTGQLMVQQFDGGDHGPIDLRWQQTEFIHDVEERISQMSLWVDRATQSNREFRLEIGLWQSGWGQGSAHGDLCWTKLAAFQSDEV